MPTRKIPKIPAKGEKIDIIIDSDAANEVDDLFAIALAVSRPDRFNIKGFIATHFAASENAGPESIEKSYDLIVRLLESAGMKDKYKVYRGGHPMQYQRVPSESEGCDFIIREAHKHSEKSPLWVLGIGACTNLASAILKDPSISNKVCYMFHARSEYSWPERSEQYNVKGDVLAVMALLKSDVPLVWFDTGTHLVASMQMTGEKVATTGALGEFIHNHRFTNKWWMADDKGIFDLGDIAWLCEPEICTVEEINVMNMDHGMRFWPTDQLGKMLRVTDIEYERTWELLISALENLNS